MYFTCADISEAFILIGEDSCLLASTMQSWICSGKILSLRRKVLKVFMVQKGAARNCDEVHGATTPMVRHKGANMVSRLPLDSLQADLILPYSLYLGRGHREDDDGTAISPTCLAVVAWKKYCVS